METKVAIVGAGPGGLVAAKYLRARGFDCAIFEQSDDIGGQWNGAGEHSGVWPSMHTNTSRVMTCFSDLRHETGLAVYPSNQEILAYLKRYAARFGIIDDVRLHTRVESVERSSSGGFIVRSVEKGRRTTEHFPFVIVASGRFNRPYVPDVAGLASFNGVAGACHTFSYKDPEEYRGLRVLVAGCAISALEIASDLAMLGASRVVCTQRRQRYVLPKLYRGVPTDHVAFTRFAALDAEMFPAEVPRRWKELLLRICGSPEQYGAPQPTESVAEAGITLSQHFLPLVAEGRITIKPWISEVAGQRVRFSDGTEEEFDGIIFGTGYELSLAFLNEEIQRTLDLDRTHIELHNFTVHPDLPGLAFLGMFDQAGPYFPVLELQARWITYVWSGVVEKPKPAQVREGLARVRAQRGQPQKQMMNSMALLFSRAAGVEPSLAQFPSLSRPLMFGPLAPTSFRLCGPDRLPKAAELYAQDAAEFEIIEPAIPVLRIPARKQAS